MMEHDRGSRHRAVGRRKLLRGSLLAGAGIGGAGLAAAGLELYHDKKDSDAASGVSAQAADSRFVSAVEFFSDDAIRLIEGWPAVEFPKQERSISASVTMPRDSAILAVDLVWTTAAGGDGDVRWVGGISWVDPAIPLANDASGARWNAMVATVPSGPAETTITRLGNYSVDPSAPVLNLRVTREGDRGEDTFAEPVLLLGAIVSVAAPVPFA